MLYISIFFKLKLKNKIKIVTIIVMKTKLWIISYYLDTVMHLKKETRVLYYSYVNPSKELHA